MPSSPNLTATAQNGTPASVQVAIRSRIASYDWREVRASLHAVGHARLPGLLSRQQCDEMIEIYHDRKRFRSFIDMAAHRFGEGSYRYFANPLPPLVRSLRTHVYARLAPTANAWNRDLGLEPRFPLRLAPFLAQCHDAEQLRPTPLLLRYEAGGFNCVHQDVYGSVAFPFQLACLLSPSSRDPRSGFEGGEFILSEQRPRQQTRVEALTLQQGEGLIFANQVRPIEGTRGPYRAIIKHGVSRVRTGERFTLGIIFHDAR